MATDYRHLSLRREGAVDWLTLDRPEKFNALSVALVDELRDYFFGLNERTETRIVVLRGAGKHFCAGLDIEEGGQPQGGNAPVGRGWGFQSYLADVYLAMRRCPQPIISLVQGAACGGGFSFVMASDIRIAAENARMNAAYIKLGLSACDMGCSYFLPRLVGTSIASELMLTGRFIDAERALATGLVSQVVPESELEAAARVFVDEMLATSPMGLRLTKEGLTHAIDAGSLEAAMAIENRNQILCSKTKDFREGMMAFLEKRAPRYEDR